MRRAGQANRAREVPKDIEEKGAGRKGPPGERREKVEKGAGLEIFRRNHHSGIPRPIPLRNHRTAFAAASDRINAMCRLPRFGVCPWVGFCGTAKKPSFHGSSTRLRRSNLVS